jgi:hypothetical protein
MVDGYDVVDVTWLMNVTKFNACESAYHWLGMIHMHAAGN